MRKSTSTGQQQGSDLESVIGIDIGGTKTKACLVKVATGEVLAEATEPTPCTEGGAAVLRLVDDLARRMETVSTKRGQKAQVLGLALPELVTLDGGPASAWNFDWQDLDFRTPLNRFNPLRVDSDVRAAAFAEGWIGRAGVSTTSSTSPCRPVYRKPWSSMAAPMSARGGFPSTSAARSLCFLTKRGRKPKSVRPWKNSPEAAPWHGAMPPLPDVPT
jgi:hypothetical protein